MTAEESAEGGQKRRRRFRSSAFVPAILLRAPLIWLLSHVTTLLAKRLKVVAVAAISAGIALAPMPLAPAHDPLALAAAESGRHAVLAAQEAAEHGHSHDDGEANEQSAGHMHGHDPADHSHQLAFFVGSDSHGMLPILQGWPSARSGPPDPATGFGIDRPPKQVMSL